MAGQQKCTPAQAVASSSLYNTLQYNPVPSKKSTSSKLDSAMADPQRIHPVDAEAPSPSAPLASRDSLASEKGDPAQQYPPIRRTFPVSHTRPPKKRRGCCCRFICWLFCLLLLLIVAVAATGGILYLIFRPKAPKYSIDRLSISNFSIAADLTVSTGLDVTITARNPNKKIGIYYEDGSDISVWYSDAKLCSGALPEFYQGHQNTTVLDVVLTGQTQLGSTLMNALNDQQQTGQIPLLLRAKVPVKVKFGRLKLPKVKFLVRCNLVVDSLNANKQIKIKTSSCKIRVKR
ncbi:hypothetical protein ACLOJK_014298 [Asimina triloba]